MSKRKSFILGTMCILFIIFSTYSICLLPTNFEYDEAFGRIGGYTTYYSDSVENRKFNIMLAAKYFDGLKISAGESLSFNGLVGARTEERGFKIAKVIVNGEYTDGVGGGVCQLSSTLYNAWITSGLEVVKVTSHSLPSGYVALSRDATVSENIDLVLRNNTDYPVTIFAVTDENCVSIRLYGKKTEFSYNLVSEMIEEIPPKLGKTLEIQDSSLKEDEIEIINGRCGYRSRAILEKCINGTVIESKVVREDYYLPIDTKIIRKIACNK